MLSYLNSCKYLLLTIACFIACNPVKAEETDAYLYVLGVVQDAGFPQTGCYADHCMPAWHDPALRQGAVSVGLIDPGAGKKYLFEATPDFPSQFFELEKEAPSEQFEFAGIFLTHAHIGHYTGLMFLGHEAMGASNIPVYAMPRMMDFLQTNGPWSQLVDYRNIILSPLQAGVTRSLGRLRITPFLVPHRDEYSETVGYRVDGPNKSAIFIPDINKWSQWGTDLSELVKAVDYALIDATFYAEGELPGRDMSRVPHPYVVESMDILEGLSDADRNKVWFIHMNHTNPLLDAGSKQAAEVKTRGFNIAVEGLRLVL